MQFTPQETKLIDRLRKQERGWPKMRWIMVTSGVFGAVASICIVVGLYRTLHVDTLPSYEVLFFAMLWPKCLLLMIGSAYLIVWPIANWHGPVNRMLLLRLLDVQQSRTAPDAKSS